MLNSNCPKLSKMLDTIELSPDQARFLIKKYGKITWSGIQELLELPKEKKKIAQVKTNKNLTELKLLLRLSGFDYAQEHRFSDRRYRFDIVLLPIELKIAIEYNGIFSEKSRHTTVTGYSKDREKINLATSLGWNVFEYTPLNFTNVVDDLKKLINS